MNERDTFRADQDEAARRDQDAWEANLASAQCDVLMKASHSHQHQNMGNLLAAAASLLNVTWVLAFLYGIAYLAHLITGVWF